MHGPESVHINSLPEETLSRSYRLMAQPALTTDLQQNQPKRQVGILGGG